MPPQNKHHIPVRVDPRCSCSRRRRGSLSCCAGTQAIKAGPDCARWPDAFSYRRRCCFHCNRFSRQMAYRLFSVARATLLMPIKSGSFFISRVTFASHPSGGLNVSAQAPNICFIWSPPDAEEGIYLWFCCFCSAPESKCECDHQLMETGSLSLQAA